MSVFFESFDSLVEYVLTKCVQSEKKIVEGEINYIKENNWEKYMVLLSNVVNKSHFGKHTLDRGSATQSAIIAKSVLDECHLVGEESKLLKYEYLYHYTFMMWTACGNMGKEGISDLYSIDSALEKSINTLGLKVRQVLLEEKVELDVISYQPISDEDFEVCKRNAFKYNCSDEDKAVLKKYLIIAIDANNRI